MKPRRILYINPFAQQISGPDQSLLTLLRHLDRQRYQACVWIPTESPHISAYRQAGAELILQEAPALQRFRRPLQLPVFWLANRRAAKQLDALLISKQIDLVHSNMETLLFPAAVCGHRNVPLVYHVRGTSFYRPAWLGKLLARYLAAKAGRLLCISEAVHQLVAPFAEARAITLYNPVDDMFFATPPSTPALPNSFQEWRLHYRCIIGTAGRINPRKNLETFVRAAALVQQQDQGVGFLIVGGCANDAERNYGEHLRQLAASLGVMPHIYFTGGLNDMRPAYGAMQVCTLLSHSEGLGRTLTEAAAMGVALLGSDVDGIREVISANVSGLLVPPNSPPATAKAMLQLAGDAPMLRQMGQAARQQAAQTFNAAAYAKKVESIYEELLNSQKA